MTLHLGWSGFGAPVLVGAILLGGSFLHPARAQQPTAAPSAARRHSLSLDAQSVANGGASQIFGNPGGLPFAETAPFQSVSDRRVASNRTNLAISVRNLATTPDNIRVEWFFVALPINEPASSNHEVIFHRDAQTLAIPAGKTATQVVSSPEVQAVYERATTVTASPLGYPNYGAYVTTVQAANRQKGLIIRGWMVRLVAEDGTILAAKGSSQTYEDIAANPAKLAGMLARPGPLSSKTEIRHESGSP